MCAGIEIEINGVTFYLLFKAEYHNDGSSCTFTLELDRYSELLQEYLPENFRVLIDYRNKAFKHDERIVYSSVARLISRKCAEQLLKRDIQDFEPPRKPNIGEVAQYHREQREKEEKERNHLIGGKN